MLRMSFLTWRRRGLIVATNFVVLAVFMGLGYVLDHWIGTWPLLFIVGFILSFPVTLVALMRILRREIEASEHTTNKNI